MIDAHFRSVAYGIAARGLKILVKTPAMFLPSMIFPLFFLIAFAGGLTPVGKVPGFEYTPGYTTFVFGFVLLQAAAFGGIFTGFGIARDFESGFAQRLLVGAPNRKAIVAGYALVAVGRAAFSIVVVTVAALIGNMQVTGNGVDILGLAGFALLVNLAATLWAAGVAMRLKTIQAGPLMQIPTFLVLFLTPVYVPFDLLQGWIKTVASVNPLTPVLEAIRALLAGTGAEPIPAYSLIAGLVVVFSIWAIRGLHKAEEGT